MRNQNLGYALTVGGIVAAATLVGCKKNEEVATTRNSESQVSRDTTGYANADDAKGAKQATATVEPSKAPGMDGVKGVVTIRFTIHRDGRVSDVTILKSSGAPPYDLAAKKAIELSSPLRALPQDFPKPTERVTCMFYYNMDIGRDE